MAVALGLILAASHGLSDTADLVDASLQQGRRAAAFTPPSPPRVAGGRHVERSARESHGRHGLAAPDRGRHPRSRAAEVQLPRRLRQRDAPGGRAVPPRPSWRPLVPPGLGSRAGRLADLPGRSAAGQGAQRSPLPAAPRPRGRLRGLRRACPGDRVVAGALSGAAARLGRRDPRAGTGLGRDRARGRATPASSRSAPTMPPWSRSTWPGGTRRSRCSTHPSCSQRWGFWPSGTPTRRAVPRTQPSGGQPSSWARSRSCRWSPRRSTTQSPSPVGLPQGRGDSSKSSVGRRQATFMTVPVAVTTRRTTPPAPS